MMTKEETWLLNEKYKGHLSKDFLSDCERLRQGEPLGYVIGNVPFLDCDIFLDSKPLIPRPETEFWTDQLIQYIIRDYLPYCNNQTLRILDLCTGSGAIGIAVAKAIPAAEIIFSDIDCRHTPTIKKNIRHNLGHNALAQPKYSIVTGNLFEHITGTFEFIVTNPPYIDSKAHTVETSVTDYEPHIALFGGTDGIQIIKEIISQSAKFLTPSVNSQLPSQLWIEHEPFQVNDINTLASHYHMSHTNHHDQYSTYRYTILSMR
jgi:release factor glutamine methyltransferase